MGDEKRDRDVLSFDCEEDGIARRCSCFRNSRGRRRADDAGEGEGKEINIGICWRHLGMLWHVVVTIGK